jgi:RNA polymerase sigma factor (sigma-70 family)
MAESSFAEQDGEMEKVRAIRSNNEAALKLLYTSNFHKVEHFVLNNNGTTDQAKDVFQEAFIAVWRNIQLDRFQPQNESALDGYLFRIARNKWLDYLRSGHYKNVVPMDAIVIPDIEADLIPKEENDHLALIKKHFVDLGENCKKILTMYYYKNDSLRKIADEMGWTEPTAKNNKYRCIQRLRELVNKDA